MTKHQAFKGLEEEEEIEVTTASLACPKRDSAVLSEVDGIFTLKEAMERVYSNTAVHRDLSVTCRAVTRG